MGALAWSCLVSRAKRLDIRHRAARGRGTRHSDDARADILALPKARQDDPAVQATIKTLLMAASGQGPVFTAHAGVDRKESDDG